MPGVKPVFMPGHEITYIANVLIRGGQLVMPDATTTRIKPTTGAVAECLGVAEGDMSAYNFANADSTDAWGNPITASATYPPSEGAVASHGIWPIVAAGAIPFGSLVVSAADGKVAVVGANTFDKVIGRCVGSATSGGNGAAVADGAKARIRLGGVGA